MKYPLVPLINDLTFPLLFFWFCLPFGILLIMLVFWLQHLLTEGNGKASLCLGWLPSQDSGAPSSVCCPWL
uniref:Adipogenin n=1 Tax=Salvator merianae TaxID=96440 RepID=A0A8D0CDB4_SALMN